MEVIGIDHVEYFLENKYQIKVENNGDIKFCFVENFPVSQHVDYGDFDNMNNPMIQCRFNYCKITLSKDDLWGKY